MNRNVKHRFSNVTTGLALLAVLVFSGFLRAQPPPPNDTPQTREKLEALRVWRLTEELNLSEDQSAQFFPKLKQLRQVKDDFRAQRGVLMDELTAELAKKPPATARLKAALDSLQTIEDNRRAIEARVKHEIGQILTIEQQARMTVFQANFERQTRRVIKQIDKDRKSGSKGNR